MLVTTRFRKLCLHFPDPVQTCDPPDKWVLVFEGRHLPSFSLIGRLEGSFSCKPTDGLISEENQNVPHVSRSVLERLGEGCRHEVVFSLGYLSILRGMYCPDTQQSKATGSLFVEASMQSLENVGRYPKKITTEIISNSHFGTDALSLIHI